ncbi:uncharacterized protein J4E92_001677 [Alternaria infectoria]|uniref:uncharacterized protein n=1 Tax=Alternaria infectoria TaxID=45303 RepID=UPI00221F02E9|nr:uncharacterized protein J4E92_001677 [Alternaria infectoria]KAI4936952.1 hypothetical protein J4E92_001677 [Alternaria infectoria]
MASTSSSVDVPAPDPTVAPTIQSPGNQALNDVEKIRDLVARRNQALDSLDLDQEEKDELRKDLNQTGWPVTLCKGGSQAMRATNESFDTRDLYALLCIMRHMIIRHPDVVPDELNLFFLNQDSKKFSNKWSKMQQKCNDNWNEADDEELIRLYEGINKTFKDIASEHFAEFREAAKKFPEPGILIEIAHLTAKKRLTAKERKAKQMALANQWKAVQGMSSNDPVATASGNTSTILSNLEYLFVYNGLADVIATESQRDGRTGPFADAYANAQMSLRLSAAVVRAEEQKLIMVAHLASKKKNDQGSSGNNQGVEGNEHAGQGYDDGTGSSAGGRN